MFRAAQLFLAASLGLVSLLPGLAQGDTGGMGAVVEDATSCNILWLNSAVPPSFPPPLVTLFLDKGKSVTQPDGTVKFSCSGTLPFGGDAPGGGTYATVEEICAFPVLGDLICENGLNGPVKFDFESTGIPCQLLSGSATTDYQVTVTGSGQVSIKCTFDA